MILDVHSCNLEQMNSGGMQYIAHAFANITYLYDCDFFVGDDIQPGETIENMYTGENYYTYYRKKGERLLLLWMNFRITTLNKWNFKLF